jgi:phage major head subunit gpT-like protein
MRGVGIAGRRFHEDNVNLLQKNGKTTICVDGQYFYDTDHPNGLNQNGTGTFQNLWTGMTLNAPNLQTRYQYMTQLKDANGKRMGIRPNILEYGPDHFIDVPVLLEAPIIAAAGTTATSNAGISNPLLVAAARLGLTPVLNNDLEAGVWYLHDTRVMKPFIIAEETPPMGMQMRVDPLDPSVWEHREFLFGSEATAGYGPGLPHLSTRCEE